jgi:predicted acyltransferase
MAADQSIAVTEKGRAAAAAGQAMKVSPAPEPGEGRLVSLDALRGFIMFWIAAGGGAVVLRLLALKPNTLTNFLIVEFNHSLWAGLHFWDCIWPCFMLMVGISIPLSFAKRSRTQTYPEMLKHAVIRFAIIFLLSSLRGSISDGYPEWIELSGVLQPIAFAYLVAFLLVRKSQWVQAAVGGAILAANVLIMAFASAPGVQAGSYLEPSNIIRYIDLQVLGRTYHFGNTFGEGGTVLCIWFPIPTTILGMLIGEWLMSARSKESKVKMIAGAGILCLAMGYALSLVVPIVFKLVTASFVLVSAGWACLMLLLFYWVIDVRGYRRWTLPLVVIGCNSIFIYMFPSFVPLGHTVSIFTTDLAATSGQLEPLLRDVIVLVVQWLILFWMYRNKIIIKV